MKIKAILIDLFHTLLSIQTAATDVPTTAAILGITEKEWLQAVFSDTDKRLRGELSNPEEIFHDIIHKLKKDFEEERILYAIEMRRKRFASSFQNIEPHIITTLSFLKERGYKLALISNADKLESADFYTSKIAPFFDAITFSCDIGYYKPEKAIYLKTLEKLGFKPDETIFIGDGGSDELRGAKAIGLTTVMTTEFSKKLWPERIAERLPYSDFTIEHLSEIIPLLDSIEKNSARKITVS